MNSKQDRDNFPLNWQNEKVFLSAFKLRSEQISAYFKRAENAQKSLIETTKN